jgi:hypothetical protein
MFSSLTPDLKATGIPNRETLVELLMVGNTGISFDKLVTAWLEMTKLSSDSQQPMTARRTTTLAIQKAASTCYSLNLALEGFKGAQALNRK